jgi:hypothetical protein
MTESSQMNNNFINNDEADDHVFCDDGMAMNMFMDGFTTSLFTSSSTSSKSSPPQCVIYLAPRWILDSYGKFVGAMIYTVLLCIVNEGLVYVQSQMRMRWWWKNYLRQNSRKLLSTCLYGLQQFISAAVMLISMTFSVELFSCVIIGIVLGKIMFPQSVVTTTTTTTSSSSTSSTNGDHDHQDGEQSSNTAATTGNQLTSNHITMASSPTFSGAESTPRIRQRRRVNNDSNPSS